MPQPIDEVCDALHFEAVRSIDRVHNDARQLHEIGNTLYELTAELHATLRSGEMMRLVHTLRSLAFNGDRLLTELQREASRLETIATITQASAPGLSHR